jgi:hypothetical protein
VSQRTRLERALAALPEISLIALTAAFCLQKIRSYDYWWHLRTGQLIAETGAVPRVDPYSYTAPGSTWIDVHWLFQLALNAVYSLGGHAAVILAKLVLVVTLLAIVGRTGRRFDRPALNAAALGLMLVVVIYRAMPRPELPTFVLVALVLALFDRFERRGDAWIYALVPIQLVWANFHGLFAVGLIVCGLHLVGELVRPWMPSGGPLRPPRVWNLLAAGAMAFMACLANPNTSDLLLYPLTQLGMIGVDRPAGLASIEISSLVTSWHLLTPLYLTAFAAVAALSLGVLVANWRRARAADFLVWGTFLLLALAALRNMALFAIAATPILVRNANELLDRAPPLRRARPLTALLVSALLLLLAADAVWGRFFERIGAPRETGFGVVGVMVPRGAVDWIAEHRPSGPLAHHMSDGGYLIWRLYPEYRVMLDGRLEVYGGEKNRRLWVDSPEKFRELDRTYRFGTAVVRFNEYDQGGLLGALYRDRGWKLVFADDVAAVFVRSADAARFPEVDVGDPDLFPPIEGERDFVTVYRIRARARFYAAVGRRDLERRVLRELGAR